MSASDEAPVVSCLPVDDTHAGTELPIPDDVEHSVAHTLDAVDDDELVECFQALSPPPGDDSATNYDNEKALRTCTAARVAFTAFEVSPSRPHADDAAPLQPSDHLPQPSQFSASLSSLSGVAPHRVFSKDEISALMAQRRQREKTLQDERATAKRNKGPASAARPAGAVGLRPAPPALFASSTTHPMAYPMGFAGPPVPAPAGVEFAAPPPPPPYTQAIPPDVVAAQACAAQQQQQQQMFGLWGYHQQIQYVNPNTIVAQSMMHPFAAAYDPATMLRMQQQMQQQPPVTADVQQVGQQGGSIGGLSVQEIGVLARLITRAQEEQKQQPFFQGPSPLQSLSTLLNHHTAVPKINTPLQSAAQEIIGATKIGNEGRAENLYNAS